jgi:hypothetical protein
MGLATLGAGQGDRIVVLLGGDDPFILQRRDADRPFEMVGEVYVQGMLGGEIMREHQDEGKWEIKSLLYSERGGPKMVPDDWWQS